MAVDTTQMRYNTEMVNHFVVNTETSQFVFSEKTLA